MALRQLTKLYGDFVTQHRPLKSVSDGQTMLPSGHTSKFTQRHWSLESPEGLKVWISLCFSTGYEIRLFTVRC
jgi:hypothetical protein